MAAVLHNYLPSLPDESQLVRSGYNFLKRTASDFDLDDIFLEAEAQLPVDSIMSDFMLQENVSSCDRRPSMELQPHPAAAAARDDHHVRHHQAAETKKRTRNESIAFSEQLRRKKMRQLCSSLHSLLPIDDTRKVSRYSLIEETSNHIRSLQLQIRELQTQKEQLLAEKELTDGAELNHHPTGQHDESSKDSHLNSETRQSLTDSTSDHTVSVDVYGTEVIVAITSSRMPRQLWRIYQELDENELDIQRADFYTSDSLVFLYIHANCLDIERSMSIQSSHSLEAGLQSIY